jgi:molecular chaperone GrpE (heat shock protein)
MADESIPSFGQHATDSSSRSLVQSTILRLCEEVVVLREHTQRQHRLFERELVKLRDELRASFDVFAANTQRAYQQLRQELHGEKRVSLTLLSELLDLGFDLERLESARPAVDDLAGLRLWADSVSVQVRKVRALLERLGVHRYDAVVGSVYNPALHERVGTRTVEGIGPDRIAEQREHGYASQQPDFVLRRAKVYVTE